MIHHYQKWLTFPGPFQSVLPQICNLNLLVFWNATYHRSRPPITVMVLSVSCWLVASVLPGLLNAVRSWPWAGAGVSQAVPWPQEQSTWRRNHRSKQVDQLDEGIKKTLFFGSHWLRKTSVSPHLWISISVSHFAVVNAAPVSSGTFIWWPDPLIREHGGNIQTVMLRKLRGVVQIPHQQACGWCFVHYLHRCRIMHEQLKIQAESTMDLSIWC